jgi:ABC-2 type transport system permease protein
MTTLIQLEILRTLRNKRYLLFTVLYPALLYVFFLNAYNGGNVAGGTPAKLYFMVSMATFGAVGAVLTGSAQRISLERKSGWVRQLRLTALPSWSYVTSKIVSTFATTLPAVVAVLLLGHFYGNVDLSASKWISLALIIWIGSMIFAALSVAMGYRLDPDSVQPATLLVYLPMILLGGTYFFPEGWLHKVAQALPTWQLHVICGDIVTGVSTPASAFLVIAAWLAGFLALAVVAVVSANRQDS